MGGASKRNLSSLAAQFSKRKGVLASQHDPQERTRLVEDDGFTHSPFRDDDDNEDEVSVNIRVRVLSLSVCLSLSLSL
jgi:hypothetical protein